EAAAAGRPLIASDVPGCREIAIHNETGLLVPPRNAAALADAMQTLASDSLLRRRLGERARELVCNQFTVERVNAQTLQIYRELLSE
ncbi:MAG: glycosyltransferase, partial [Burkholderiaceae bacterium]|nr:glycosyltransferase [Burkholderiaceae bacterium]